MSTRMIQNKSFNHRDFLVPPYLLYAAQHGSQRFDTARYNVTKIATNTRLVHLLDYLDVPDHSLEEVSLGAIDGTWTESSARIMRDFAIESNQLQKLAHFREIGTEWHCPCCDNDKYGTVRKSKKKDSYNISFVGHHDHIADLTARYTFPTTVVCEYCNQLDTTLKRLVEPYVESPWLQSDADKRYDASMADTRVLKYFSFSVEDLKTVIAGNSGYDLKRLDPNMIRAAADIYNRKMHKGLSAYVNDNGRRTDNLVYGNKQMQELATLLTRDADFLTSYAYLLEPGRTDVKGKTFNTRGPNTLEVFHDANEMALVNFVRDFDDHLKYEIYRLLVDLSEKSTLHGNFLGFVRNLEWAGIQMSASKGARFLEWTFTVNGAAFHESEIGFGNKQLFMSGILPACVESQIERHISDSDHEPCVLTGLTVQHDIEAQVQEELSLLYA